MAAQKRIKQLERVNTSAFGKCRVKESREVVSRKKVDAFRFIDEHKDACPVALLCRKLCVSRGGYYAWKKRLKSRQQLSNEALLLKIVAIHQASNETYGYPRIHAALRKEGESCGRSYPEIIDTSGCFRMAPGV